LHGLVANIAGALAANAFCIFLVQKLCCRKQCSIITKSENVTKNDSYMAERLLQRRELTENAFDTRDMRGLGLGIFHSVE